jgi:hypothetical protein
MNQTALGIHVRMQRVWDGLPAYGTGRGRRLKALFQV